MIERPTMLLPASFGGPGGEYGRTVREVREALQGRVLFVYAYPKSVGRNGRRSTATPVEGLEVQELSSFEVMGAALSYLRPDWTIPYRVWYTTWGSARQHANLYLQHSGHVVVPCTGTTIVPDVPEEFVIGYDCKHQRSSSEVQVPTAQLVGRRVCLMGGIPRRQFTTWCELTIQGVEVVGVCWAPCWYFNTVATGVIWNEYLERTSVVGSPMSKAALLVKSVKNALAWWELGIRRVERWLKDRPVVQV